MTFLNTILDSVLDTVFGVRCISCGKNGSDLCLDCIIKSPAPERESADWIFPMYDYRDPNIKKALWLLKYKGRKKLANTFAETIYGRMLEELADLSLIENFVEPILIPIPLSRERHRERGFNQAEIICQEIIKINNQQDNTDERINLSLENKILIKPKETLHQAHIKDRQTRLKNIIGSFAVRDNGKVNKENTNNIANKIKNRNIILIDDITTTGATLSEAKKMLRRAGARKVIAFTVAH